MAALPRLVVEPLMRFGSWYSRSLERRPVATKCVTSTVLGMVGDIGAQAVERRVQREAAMREDGRGVAYAAAPHRWERTARMGVIGACMGVIGHRWYGTLDRLFGPSRTLPVVLRKLALDASCFSPSVTLFTFLANSALQRRSPSEAADLLRREYLFTLKMVWVVWPTANLVILKFVPLPYRVLANNCVGVCWSSFLSSQVNKKPIDSALVAAGAPAIRGGDDGEERRVFRWTVPPRE